MIQCVYITGTLIKKIFFKNEHKVSVEMKKKPQRVENMTFT